MLAGEVGVCVAAGEEGMGGGAVCEEAAAASCSF